jgi:histidine triad (HIT) family protein
MCLFCSIVAGETPAAVVMDNADVVGFLDIRPVFPGHVLVVPRDHVDTLPALPASHVVPLFSAVQQVCDAVVDAMGAQGTFVAVNNVVSQSVPHLHVHVVPRTKGDGLRGFFWPRHKYDSDDQMADVAARISASLLRTG